MVMDVLAYLRWPYELMFGLTMPDFIKRKLGDYWYAIGSPPSSPPFLTRHAVLTCVLDHSELTPL